MLCVVCMQMTGGKWKRCLMPSTGSFCMNIASQNCNATLVECINEKLFRGCKVHAHGQRQQLLQRQQENFHWAKFSTAAMTKINGECRFAVVASAVHIYYTKYNMYVAALQYTYILYAKGFSTAVLLMLLTVYVCPLWKTVVVPSVSVSGFCLCQIQKKKTTTQRGHSVRKR